MSDKLLKRFAATAVILITCSTAVLAQQDAKYTQFMFSKLPQNAAYTGSKEALS